MPRVATRKLSPLRKPQDMSLEAWQRERRASSGGAQPFALRNLGADPVFSDFEVPNPQSRGTYRVAIRGAWPGENHCTCPDFATNALGTCKPIEFVLGKLERRRGAQAAFQRGFRPPYSEIVLQYGAKREMRFRPGASCPRALAVLAALSRDRVSMTTRSNVCRAANVRFSG